MWCMWVYLELQLNCSEELNIKGNKHLKCEWILSYLILVQELSRESCEHPVTFWWPMWCQELWNQRISDKSDKTVKNALSHQNSHQHMLSTFRFQPGILGVRTVLARVAAISSQARAMVPCPALSSLLQPSKGPGLFGWT